MLKICFLFDHLNYQGGVCRSVIAIANLLSKNEEVEVTLIPIYRYVKTTLNFLSPKVKVKPVFRFFYRGMSRVVKKIPSRFLYKCVVRDYYDIEIAFEKGTALYIIANTPKVSPTQKKIVWLHGYDEGLKQGNCYLKMDKVVSVSKYNANRLKNELPGVNVDYCYNPIDENEVCQLGAEPIDISRPSGPLLISVGRFSPEKGYIRLIDCLYRLKRSGLEFHFWLIGDGLLMKELRDKVEKLELQDRVLFLGLQQNPHKYTSKADVFVCSSFSEGYSTVCAEAIMLGVPIITTPVSGADEIIKDAGCGMITGMDDESLYNALETIIRDEGMIKKWKETLSSTRYNFSKAKRAYRLYDILGLTNSI